MATDLTQPAQPLPQGRAKPVSPEVSFASASPRQDQDTLKSEIGTANPWAPEQGPRGWMSEHHPLVLAVGAAAAVSLVAGAFLPSVFGNRNKSGVGARTQQPTATAPSLSTNEGSAPTTTPSEVTQTPEINDPTSPGLHTVEIPAGTATTKVPRPDGTYIELAPPTIYPTAQETANVLLGNIAAIATTGDKTLIANFSSNSVVRSALEQLAGTVDFNFSAFPHAQESIFGDSADPPLWAFTVDAAGNKVLQLVSGRVLMIDYLGGPGAKAVWQGEASHVVAHSAWLMPAGTSFTFDAGGNVASQSDPVFDRNPSYVPG